MLGRCGTTRIRSISKAYFMHMACCRPSLKKGSHEKLTPLDFLRKKYNMWSGYTEVSVGHTLSRSMTLFYSPAHFPDFFLEGRYYRCSISIRLRTVCG